MLQAHLNFNNVNILGNIFTKYFSCLYVDRKIRFVLYEHMFRFCMCHKAEWVNGKEMTRPDIVGKDVDVCMRENWKKWGRCRNIFL